GNGHQHAGLAASAGVNLRVDNHIARNGAFLESTVEPIINQGVRPLGTGVQNWVDARNGQKIQFQQQPGEGSGGTEDAEPETAPEASAKDVKKGGRKVKAEVEKKVKDNTLYNSC